MSRLGRTFKAGRSNIPRYYLPTSFFNRPLGAGDTLSADQGYCHNFINQIYYGDASYATSTTPYLYTNQVGYWHVNWPYTLGWNGPYHDTHPVYCVRPSDPSQNITFQTISGYDYSGGPVKWSAGEYSNLQAHFNSVPIPDKSLCPAITGSGDLLDIMSGGSDGSCCIWNLDTDEMWEFWVLNNSSTYATASTVCGTNWTARYGGYIPGASAFDGVLPNNWGSRACSLGEVGGLITYQDLVNAWHGEPICHAIACTSGVNRGASYFHAPATRGDGITPNGNDLAAIPGGYPGAGGANPAYGLDVTVEGLRFRFPANVDLSGISHPVGLAVAMAIRDYGLIIMDTANAVAFYLEDGRTFGSPYNLNGENAINPWSLNWAPWGDPRWDVRDPAGWTIFNHLPWTELQLLNPISS